MRTRDVLGIYWNSSVGEVDGQTFYLFSKNKEYVSPEFPLELWPANTEAKKQKLEGDEWVIWLWDVKFSGEQSNWLETTRKTQLYFIHNGSSISWCGLDGCFSEPPGLFDPNEMSEGVYAATNNDGQFFCYTDINDEFAGLTRDDLIKFRNIVCN